MEVIITALGSSGHDLVAPVVHEVTALGAFISEIQMHDHEKDDGQQLFYMLLRAGLKGTKDYPQLQKEMVKVASKTGLSIKVWSKDAIKNKPKIAVLTTKLTTVPEAIIKAVTNGQIDGEIVAMIGNRDHCQPLADQHKIPWHNIGDKDGLPDNDLLSKILEDSKADYICLARYMRLIPPNICWKFGGGRIINLHHGLLPSFPGAKPYADAYARRMLTYGATCHFIVPELDAGDQIIYQSTYTVAPDTPIDKIVEQGNLDNEPHCMVEGLKRVVDRQVTLQFSKVRRHP